MTVHNFPTHGLKEKRYHLAYQYLMEKQGGLCLLCGRHQEEYTRKFHIDHCHKTGKIRGLLCEPCNLGLGEVENMGCNALNTKIPLEEYNAIQSKRAETYTGKGFILIYTEEMYRDIHEKIDRWMDKRKYAVYRYLSLPGLNEEIEAYCNQFMRPRPTAK